MKPEGCPQQTVAREAISSSRGQLSPLHVGDVAGGKIQPEVWILVVGALAVFLVGDDIHSAYEQVDVMGFDQALEDAGTVGEEFFLGLLAEVADGSGSLVPDNARGS